MKSEVGVRPEEGCVVAKGEIDHANIDELTRAFHAIAASPSPAIEVDLSAVTYIDSAGICAIYDLVKEATGRPIGIIGASNGVHRILYLSGLTRLESVHVQPKTDASQDYRIGRREGGDRTTVLAYWSRSFTSDLQELVRVREFVAQVAKRAGLEASRTFDLMVAVSEASANAMEHGIPAGDLRITGIWHPSMLTVTISHPGDFRSPPHNDPTRAHRGMGLPLILGLTDEVKITCAPEEGTEVRLSLFLDSTAPHR